MQDVITWRLCFLSLQSFSCDRIVLLTFGFVLKFAQMKVAMHLYIIFSQNLNILFYVQSIQHALPAMFWLKEIAKMH